MTLPMGLINSYSVAAAVPATVWDGSLTASGLVLTGGLALSGAFASGATVIPYVSGTPPIMNAALGNQFTLSVNDNVAIVVGVPLNPVQIGQRITLTIKNISGGALGGTTFNAIFKMSAWTDPANTKNRSITWEWDGTNWIQEEPAGVDVPN